MKLCKLYGCTLDELGQRLTPKELVTWMAEYQLSPWGQERDDVSRAVGFAAVASCWTERTVKPSDLIPQYDAGDPVNRVEAQRNLRELFRGFIAGHNANEHSKGDRGG